MFLAQRTLTKIQTVPTTLDRSIGREILDKPEYSRIPVKDIISRLLHVKRMRG